MSNTILALLSRILLSAVFIPAGISKLADIGGTAGYIASAGIPGSSVLAWLAAIFEVVAGLCILVGFQTKYAAFALAAFCIFTAFVFHGGADPVQQIMMFKNIGLAGGFLALAVAGAGAWSIDARR
ncbi:MAG: DoxX family protein [Rhizobiaceae bacterium]